MCRRPPSLGCLREAAFDPLGETLDAVGVPCVSFGDSLETVDIGERFLLGKIFPSMPTVSKVLPSGTDGTHTVSKILSSGSGGVLAD